ncbi:hypothetical protein PMIN01_04671 [Paraphaeosphaeria minitans]|uniref:Uncharacterized protein n=1 Tax=Paraphaeosphaeria minitans TaxID=565426 RepID=A0A9P6GJI0_9PLEO|nr:hypothetical protein PMIN01_04671 [Paraphaeosphaeria minitans]
MADLARACRASNPPTTTSPTPLRVEDTGCTISNAACSRVLLHFLEFGLIMSMIPSRNPTWQHLPRVSRPTTSRVAWPQTPITNTHKHIFRLVVDLFKHPWRAEHGPKLLMNAGDEGRLKIIQAGN